MRPRHPLPRLWLMTDERMGDDLLAAIERLPRGAGIVFRHYSLPAGERKRLFLKVRAIARRKRLLLMLGGEPRLARAWGADGGRGKTRCGHFHGAPVHNLRELKAAERAGASFLFLSPAFPTRSHPGAPALGPLRFGLIARQTRHPVIALGGMDAGRAKRLAGFNIHGWAAIDAWARATA